MISSHLDSAGDLSTIGAFAVIVLGILAYVTGVLRPLKAKNAEWMTTTLQTEGEVVTQRSVVFVTAILKSRTRNTKKVLKAALAKDPGWPRRLRARLKAPDSKPFNSSSVADGDSIIESHGALEFKAELSGPSLPYDATRLWIQVGTRNFYFKLKRDRLLPAQS